MHDILGEGSVHGPGQRIAGRGRTTHVGRTCDKIKNHQWHVDDAIGRFAYRHMATKMLANIIDTQTCTHERTRVISQILLLKGGVGAEWEGHQRQRSFSLDSPPGGGDGHQIALDLNFRYRCTARASTLEKTHHNRIGHETTYGGKEVR